MSSRYIHMDRSIFQTMGESSTIPDQSIIYFTNTLSDYYATNTTVAGVNHIIYYTATGKFMIQITAETANKFYIHWAISLRTSFGGQLPLFTVVAENEDGSFQQSFSAVSAKHTNTLQSSLLLQLPVSSSITEPVKYYLYLNNQSGYPCYYNRSSFSLASIMIIAIDDS